MIEAPKGAFLIGSSMELVKDFTSQNSLMDFWEFFNDNSQYLLLRYEHIKGGIRAYYVAVH